MSTASIDILHIASETVVSASDLLPAIRRRRTATIKMMIAFTGYGSKGNDLRIPSFF